MTRAHILAEIRRTAAANGGVPLGRERFLTETGIKETDWSGKFWVRWGDAVREAGFEPNSMNRALPEDTLLEALASLTRELGHFPLAAEMKIKSRSTPGFPTHNTFQRFGPKSSRAAKLLSYAVSKGYDDVAALCAPIAKEDASSEPDARPASAIPFGFVYLMRSGRFYKIGRSNAVGRRERELAIQLPEKVKAVHIIKTDDPIGIEEYWHRRFNSQRKNGEWFELSPADVSAFRRRKFM